MGFSKRFNPVSVALQQKLSPLHVGFLTLGHISAPRVMVRRVRSSVFLSTRLIRAELVF